MSHQLLYRSPDLAQLINEGYDVELRSNYLLVKGIPYVSAGKVVKLGTLIAKMTVAGDVACQPSDHVAYFIGDYPCNADGSEILKIKNPSAPQKLAEGLLVNFTFSSKPWPKEKFDDYYSKMTHYISILAGPAKILDPNATACTYPVMVPDEDESIFNYFDSASSRAGIGAVNEKLKLGNVGIVGLGGTGSYILDLVAKTPVKAIHIFDGDEFVNHNAFRSPGAASIGELSARPQKVAYLKEIYSKMHRNIIPHDYYVTGSSIDELQSMDFVFLSIDSGEAKRPIVAKLQELGIPFIDVGMGIELKNESLMGIMRVTTSTKTKSDHVWNKKRIPFADGNGDDEYASNIQIADLNALNAALAVVKWKKHFGFYHDLEGEHFSTYTTSGNSMTNEDQA